MLLRKVITTFLLPMGLLWLAVGIAMIAAPRRGKLRRFLAIGWLALTLGANPMVSVALVRSLEYPYRSIAPLEATAHYDAILVLGGGSSLTHELRPQLGGSGDRLRMGAALAAAGHTDRLLTSGSAIDGSRDLSWETATLWSQMGVDPEMITRIPGPMNTAQEIEALSELAAKEGWQRLGIVTSGYHMRRAQALCRRHGIEADPLPADRKTLYGSFSVLSLLPTAGSFAQTDQSIREYIGLLAVYLFGG